jgi:hypothetical protein
MDKGVFNELYKYFCKVPGKYDKYNVHCLQFVMGNVGG